MLQLAIRLKIGKLPWLMAAGLMALLLAAPHMATARGERPGLFDYYVLSMSWSPSWCMTRKQQRQRRDDAQCHAGGGTGFVLHGLWPQFRRGWPSQCPVSREKRFVPDAVIREVLDVMPSKGLVIHEWRKHGTCSGLSPRAYFSLSEKLFRMVKVPAAYQHPTRPLQRTPRQIRKEFADANRAAGFTADSFTVICTGKGRGEALLKEIRVCFTPVGRPSRCGANEQRAQCRARVVVVPPVR